MTTPKPDPEDHFELSLDRTDPSVIAQDAFGLLSHPDGADDKMYGRKDDHDPTPDGSTDPS